MGAIADDVCPRTNEVDRLYRSGAGKGKEIVARQALPVCLIFQAHTQRISVGSPNRVPPTDGTYQNAGSDPIGTLFLCAVRVHPIGTSIVVIVLRNAELEQCRQYNTAKL